MRLDDIIKLSPAQRRRLRMWGPSRKYRREKRPNYSRDELVDYLKRHAVRSTRVLERLRKTGDPTVYDFRKAFGGWKKAVEAVFGKNPLKPTVDARYVLKSAVLYNVWTYKDYVRVRRANPEIFPPIRYVRKEFAGLRRFFYCARGESLNRTAEEYKILWRKLGRRPLIEDCKCHGLILDFPLRVFGSKASFDRFVEGLHKEERRMVKNERPQRGTGEV